MRLTKITALCFASLLSLSAQASNIDVVTQEVASQPFSERIEALGTLRANESVNITANVTETITAIHFQDNERVEALHVLAEMTNAEEQAQLQEAASTLKEAKKQYQRVLTLSKQGNATKSLLDQRKRERDTAKARLVAIQSRLKDRLIIAPYDGVLGLRNISVGALVEPGDVITTLDDDSQMKLDFSVPAVYLNEVKAGLPIEATARAYGKKTFQGTISSIDSRIDPVTRSFIVRAILPNPEYLLKPGLLMQVNITANKRESIVIPESALVSQANKQYVYVAQKGNEGEWKAVRTLVQIGGRRPGDVEIVQGLEVGQMIVVDGTIKLRDGAAIEPKEQAF